MVKRDRPQFCAVLALYAGLALGWVAFARWFMPPFLLAKRPPGILTFLKQYIELPPALFITSDILGRWRKYSGAVLIAVFLHLTIFLILRKYDLRATACLPATVHRAERRVSIALLIVSFVFLVVTALSGPRHDYYFYRQMWYEVARGHDPWFKVDTIDGPAPLNAYGPLFNLLTPLSRVNPYAPKLLFAYSYILFSILQIKSFTPRNARSLIPGIMLFALFWNPYPWVEIAVRGHFDILVGLLCLGAIRAWARGRDSASGVCLALGVLLKFQPIVLMPVLAQDHGRVRSRFLFVAFAAIAVGTALSCRIWGMSTFLPLEYAATRHATPLSIYFFVRGKFSPLLLFEQMPYYDYLAPHLMFLALMAAWYWTWSRQPDVEAASVVATVATVVFYRVAYPQYHMLPFVLGSSWAVRHWNASIKGRIARVVAISCYFAWLAAFDLYYVFDDEGVGGRYWGTVRHIVGLPAFVFGCAFVAGVIRSATPAPARESNSSQPEPVRPPRGETGF